jgi:uncharacterized protein YggE
MKTFAIVVLLLVGNGWALGQGRLVRATGNASVSGNPDQVSLQIGVLTTGATAQAAAAENASQMDAMLARLKQALGSAGTTRTVGYSIHPNYRTTSGQPPVLNGFTVTNNVQVTTTDLATVGAVIDAASQAGANNIGALNFSIKNDQLLRSQALAAAAKQARASADAIASGLGLRTGAVLSAQEGATVVPFTIDSRAAAASSTPIEPGPVQVSATVTIEVELL